MITDGPYISKTFGSASPRGRRDVVSTVDRCSVPVVADENRHNGLRRLKSRSWSSIRRWEKENELLFAMIEDESEWLAELFPEEIIAPEFFFFALEDGVLLCKLANLIQEYAVIYGKENGVDIPDSNIKFHPRNKTRGQLGQFRARENVTAFLSWCRKHRIPEVILFESNDVVQTEDLREGAREVVICLMEVARRSFKYGVKPPKLIILEKEIDEEERTENLGSPNSVDSGFDTDINSKRKTDMKLNGSDVHNGINTVDHVERKNSYNSSGVWKDKTDQKVKHCDQSMNGLSETVLKEKNTGDQTDSVQKPQSELDKKVFSLVEEYSIGKILRLKEGKYIILGRVMFVRMLNDHVLVRIGGGWDGLEHYLMTHVKTGSQTQNPVAAPAYDTRATTPVGRAEKIKNFRPLSPAAPNNSLVEVNKVESRTFTPILQPNVNARGRESPLRKTLRAKDTDEADIARAIRRIESTVSENIQKKTGSTSSLELTSSVSSCKKCPNGRRPGPSKMATPAINDISPLVNENEDMQRMQNEVAIMNESNLAADGPSLAQHIAGDGNNNEGVDDGPVINGDIDTEHPSENLLEKEHILKSDVIVSEMIVTKEEQKKQEAKEKKPKASDKKQTDVKGKAKAPTKSSTNLKSVTSTKTAQKGGPSASERKVAPASQKTAGRPTTATTTKSSAKTGTEKKVGLVNGKSTGPKVASAKVSAVKSSTVSTPKSAASKSVLQKVDAKVADKKPAASKPSTPSSAVKGTPGKTAVKKSTVTTAVKSDKKVKATTDSKKPSGLDSTDGSALSTKAKVSSESKGVAQVKVTSDAGISTPSASKKAPPAKVKATGASAKAIAIDKAKKPAAASASKALPATKAEAPKSDAAAKKVAAESKSRKTTTTSAAKPSSASAKGKDVPKKPIAHSKPASAPPKVSSSAKSSKPSTKPSSAPSSATSAKAVPSATKPAKPAAKAAPSKVSAAAGDKKSAAAKTKAPVRTEAKKTPQAAAKASAAAKGSKDVKSKKSVNEKAPKNDTKASPKKHIPDAEKETKKNVDEKLINDEQNVVELKERVTIEAVLPSSTDYYEGSTRGHMEPISIKNSNEAVVIESMYAADELSSDPVGGEYTVVGSISREQPEGFDSIEHVQNEVAADANIDENVDISKEEEASVTPENAEIDISTQPDADMEELGHVSTNAIIKTEEGPESPTKCIISETMDIEVLESSKPDQDNEEEPCLEAEDDATSNNDMEEKDAESAKFDESKLISLEEITAKCEEDDVREGAVAPTPPETPVPDTISAETAVTLQLSEDTEYDPGATPSVTPMVEDFGEIAPEPDVLTIKPEENLQELDQSTEFQDNVRTSDDNDVVQIHEKHVSFDASIHEVEDSPSMEETPNDSSEDFSSIRHCEDSEYQSQKNSDEIVTDDIERIELTDTEKAGGSDLYENDEDDETEMPSIKNYSAFEVDDSTLKIDDDVAKRETIGGILSPSEVEEETNFLQSGHSGDVEITTDQVSYGDQTVDEGEEAATAKTEETLLYSKTSEDIDSSKESELLVDTEVPKENEYAQDFEASQEELTPRESGVLDEPATELEENVVELEFPQERREYFLQEESYDTDVNYTNIELRQAHEKVGDSDLLETNAALQVNELPEGDPLSPMASGQVASTLPAGQSDIAYVSVDSDMNADIPQNEILNPEIGLQEHEDEEDNASAPSIYEKLDQSQDENKESVAIDDPYVESVKPIDLENAAMDSFTADDPFTPISDLPEEGRSPFTKDSFGNFSCEYDAEADDGAKSDEETAFKSEILEHAKESVRVARSLDDSFENVTERSEIHSDLVERSDQIFDEKTTALQGEPPSSQAGVVPQVISSPCMSSDNEDDEDEQEQDAKHFSEETTQEGEHAGGIHELQHSPMDGSFPDAGTANNLSEMYQAEAESHHVQLSYEMHQYGEEDPAVRTLSDASPGCENTNGNASTGYGELAAGSASMEYERGTQDSAFTSEGHENLTYEDQSSAGFYSEECKGPDDVESDDEDEDNMPTTSMESEKNISEFSHNLLSDEMGPNDQGYTADATIINERADVMHCKENEGVESLQEKGGQDVDSELYHEDAGENEQLMRMEDEADVQQCYSEERNKSHDAYQEEHKEPFDEYADGNDNEDHQYHIQDETNDDLVYTSQERSDVDRYVQSDEQITDGSDYVLLDSPVKCSDASSTDEPALAKDADSKEYMLASVNESGSDDSPFHHIEIKPEIGDDLLKEAESGQAPEESVYDDSKEVLLTNDGVQDYDGKLEDFNDDSQLSNTGKTESTEMRSHQESMDLPQSSDQLWRRDEEKRVDNETLSFSQYYDDGAANLVGEGVSTGPRYVYDGSDDEDGDDDYNEDETY